jgi:hypothetical protein
LSARLEYPAGHDSFWFELIDWALVERQGIASTTRSKMVLGLGWVAIPSMCRVIQFGASPAGDRVLAALRDLQRLWGGGRNKVGVEEIDQDLLIGRGGDWCYRHRMWSRAGQHAVSGLQHRRPVGGPAVTPWCAGR